MNIGLAVAVLAPTAPPVPSGTWVGGHEFSFEIDAPVRSVAVAGTFNGWNRSAYPLTSSDGKRWSASFTLPVGRHEYKFVIDGERWVEDPAARAVVDAGGNRNSLLLIFPSDYATPARLGDGHLTESAVRHRPANPKLSWERGIATIRLHVRPGDVERASVVAGRRTRPMRAVFADEFAVVMEAEVPWDRRTPLRYAFRLDDGPASLGYGPEGLRAWGRQGEFVAEPERVRPIDVPDWVERSVLYQIFPDRFDNGDPTNDHPATEPWSAEPTYINRFGGDAAGVRRRIPYLRDLGVGAVYFNPVMKAIGNHRYDPVDFYRVDPEFGTNAEFASLTRDLERAGIRTVLDQVFDHVGVTFGPFADVLRFQQESRFRDWFFIESWPVEVRRDPPYRAWYGYESMPKVDVLHPAVKAYLLESVDYWQREARIGGWRLDVADEVPMEFWREFRPRAKAGDPERWILGEMWGDASPWLQGDQWDASMNYPFRNASLGYLARGHTSASDFARELMTAYLRYAPEVSRNQMNLLSSHDVPRFLTESGGDRRRLHAAALVQFAWAGIPSVYYGDELGMEGGADPANRRPMRWDWSGEDNATLRWFRRLAELRRASRVLQSGSAFDLTPPDSPVAILGRRWGSQAAVIVVNAQDRAWRGPIGLRGLGLPRLQKLTDGLSGTEVAVNGDVAVIALDPVSARVFFSDAKHLDPLFRRNRGRIVNTYSHPQKRPHSQEVQ